MTGGEYQNFAFISYRDEGEDAEMALWLRKKLESFRIPTELRKRDPSLPKYCRRVFEYKTYGEGGPKEKLFESLKKSRYLIVICSPLTPKSEPVRKGIEYFISQKKEKNIIPLIIGGKVHAKDEKEECFPEPLRSLGKDEPRGININTEGGREIAALKIFAYMMGIPFDSVWDVHQKQLKKERNKIILTITSFLVLALLFSAKVVYDNRTINEQKEGLLISQSLYMSKEANDLAGMGCYRKAQLLAADALPTSINSPGRPYVVEAEEALRNSLNIGDYNDLYTCVDNLQGHEDGIWYADADEQKGIAISYAQDGTMRAWDLNLSEQICSTVIEDGRERPLGIFLLSSLSGRKALIAFSECFSIWDISLGRTVKKYSTSGISAPAMDKKRENLVYFDRSAKEICVFNIKKGEIVESVAIIENNVNSIAINMEHGLLAIGTGIITGAHGGSVLVWDMKNKKELASIDLESAVEHVSLSSDGLKVAYSPYSLRDGKIIAADVFDLDRVTAMLEHPASITSMSFSPSKKDELLFGSYDNDIVVWDVEKENKTEIKQPFGNGWPHCLVYSPSGNIFVGGLWEKLVVYGKPSISYAHVFGNQVDNFYYSTDGNKIYFTEEGSSSVYCIDTRTFEEERHSSLFQPKKWEYESEECAKFSKFVMDEYEITCGCYSMDGSIAYIAYGDLGSNLFIEKFKILDENVRSLGKVHLNNSLFCANDLTLSFDGSLLLVSCGVLAPEGNAAVVVDTDKMKEISRFDGFHSGVLMSCFIPNSNLVASCSMDMSVKIWDYTEKKAEKKLFKHIKYHHDMVDNVSSDNKGVLFVSSCQDGSVIIWDVTTMKPIERMQFSDENLHTTISPNGKTIALIDQGKLIIKELLPYEKLVLDVRGE